MKEEKLLYADETYAIRGAAFEVCKEMGNAFDENVYQECMEIALKERGVEFEPQKKLPLKYKDKTLGHFYQPDRTSAEFCVLRPKGEFRCRIRDRKPGLECVSNFPCRKS